MANLLLAITTNPQAFAPGAWPSVEMNGATWRFTFTFTSSSASGAYAGYHALFTAPNGGNSGGLWIAGGTLEFYDLSDSLLTSQALTWSASATLRLTFDMVAKTIRIGGMTTGNGLISWSGGGSYFNGLDTLTAGGLVGEVGYDIAGTFGDIDDGVDKLTFDAAAVAITPSNVGLLLSRRLVVDPEAVTITAEDFALRPARRVALDAATVAVTAADVGLLRSLRLAVEPESVTATAADLGLRLSRRLAIGPAAVTIATFAIGGDPSIDAATAAQNAIFTWVLAGSGLADGQVMWGRVSAKNGPMPAGTFISMRIMATARVSDDWLVTREVDGAIEHSIRGTRHPTLEISCFAGEPFGADTAANILDRVLASIKLPSVAAGLRAAGVGVGRRERVRVVDRDRSGMLDPMAIVEVGLHLGFEMVDPVAGSAIESAEVTNEITGDVFDVIPA